MGDGNKALDGAKKMYKKPDLLIHGNLTNLTRTTDCIGPYTDSGTTPNNYLSGGYGGYCY